MDSPLVVGKMPVLGGGGVAISVIVLEGAKPNSKELVDGPKELTEVASELVSAVVASKAESEVEGDIFAVASEGDGPEEMVGSGLIDGDVVDDGNGVEEEDKGLMMVLVIVVIVPGAASEMGKTIMPVSIVDGRDEVARGSLVMKTI